MTNFHNNPAVSEEDGANLQLDGSPPPGVLLADHFNMKFGYKANRPDGTRDYLFTFTLGGCGYYRIGDQMRQCRRGDVLLLTPGTPHHYGTYREDEHWEFVWCHFLPPENWQAYFSLPEVLPGLLHVQMNGEIYYNRMLNAFHRLIGDQLHGDRLHERMAYLALEEAMLLVAHQSGKDQANEWLDPRVEEVKRILLLKMQDPHTIHSLAEKVRLSPSRLAHLFKDQTGQSIIAMLVQIRLRQGAKQLEYTSKTIAEVAEDIGFQSPFYFTKQFTAAYGISPTAYRKKAHAQHSKETLTTSQNFI